MLKSLALKNIAIIESLSLSFDRGLTVITGESGSGKSILLDAIALAFGGKASPKDVLRTGADRGSVELLFDTGRFEADHPLRRYLADQGIDMADGETEVQLYREFTASASRCRINGVPVSRDVVETLRPWVIDLHGQHELTNLFQSDKQRNYLDALGGSALQKTKQAVRKAYADWAHLKAELESFRQNRQALIQQRDFLQFQLSELTEAELTDGEEDATVRQERDVLSHAEKLMRVSAQASGILQEGDGQTPSVLDLLSDAEKRLSEGSANDQHLDALLTQLEGLHTELKAFASDLARYHERLEYNPERIEELTERLDLLEKLKRKYGPTLQEVIETRDRVAEELGTLEAAGENFEALEAACAEKEQALKTASDALSAERRELAEILKDRLLTQLEVLGLPSVSFDLRFAPIAFSADGQESVEFLFSANPGEPLRPLAKVASGGELSRFLLALKVLTAQNDGLQTLVFDEIDSGVSGPTARAVAEKLASLSRYLQVLVITHQPMIAAMGEQHWHVEKSVVLDDATNESVLVAVESLIDEKRRLSVLSRLVSGTETSDETVERFIVKLREQALAFHASPVELAPGAAAPRLKA